MKHFNKILLIDDDSVALFLIERMLKKVVQSEQIVKATNGEEALQILEESCSSNSCPELIVLDLNMPLMDGFEFLRTLHRSNLAPLTSKIVLLTSSESPYDVERAKKYSLAGYLQKPLTEAKLKKVFA